MGIFMDIKKRIEIDWIEWKNYKISLWNVKRDRRLIERAIKRARIKNASDGKTYYVLRDVTGGINEFNSSDVRYWTRVGMLPKMDINKRLTEALAIVTSSSITRNTYTKAQNKKEEKTTIKL